MIALSFIAWVLLTIAGTFLGRKRNQAMLGFLLTLFLGPVGLLVLFFLPDKKRDTEEEEQRLTNLEQQLDSQRDQQSREMLEHARATRSKPPEPRSTVVLRIARNGEDLGEMNLDDIKTMLGTGQLSSEDFYLDPTGNEWLPLECHPALIG